MISDFFAPFSNPIFWPSLIAALFASIVGGIMGSFVIIRRMSALAGSISHAVLGGLGLCLWAERVVGLFCPPILGALAAALLASFVITYLKHHHKEREDAAISAVWSIGMAIGLVFISKTPGYNVELLKYLVGNILWTAPTDVWGLVFLDICIVLFIGALYRPLLALAFDEEQTRLQGIATTKLDYALTAIVAVTVVMLMSVVGAILVIAMLTLPAMTAALVSKRFSTLIFTAMACSLIAFFIGFLASYHLDWPLGATTSLSAAGLYGCVLLMKK